MVSFDSDEIRNKKVDVLHAVMPIPNEAEHQSTVRGQYDKGWIGGKQVRADQVEAAWQILMRVLDAWKASPPKDFPNYAGGTLGPDATQGLLVQQGHSWPAPVELGGGLRDAAELPSCRAIYERVWRRLPSRSFRATFGPPCQYVCGLRLRLTPIASAGSHLLLRDHVSTQALPMDLSVTQAL